MNGRYILTICARAKVTSGNPARASGRYRKVVVA